MSNEDANRELRSIMLSLLHLPPLPTVVTALDREDFTILNTDHTESSHTIIASLLEWMATLDNNRLNGERMMAQTALHNSFQEQLAKIDLDGPIEAIYNFYCHHTRLWVNCYTPAGNRLLFKPIESVCVGDNVHLAMLSYAKAQYHYFKDGNEELQICDKLSFADILRKCAEWSVAWNATAQGAAAQDAEGGKFNDE